MRPRLTQRPRKLLTQKIATKIKELIECRDFPQLEALCRQELTRTPNHGALIHAKAIALSELGRLQEAITTLEQRFKNPNSHGPLLLLCRLYARVNAGEKQKALLESILENDKTCYEALVQLGGILIKEEDYQRARHLLTEASCVKPDLPHAYIALANLATEHRQYKRAEKLLEKAAQLNKSPTNIRIRQFVAQGKSENWDGVEERYFELIKTPELDDVQKYNVTQVYSRFLRVHGRVDEAIEILESLGSVPDSVEPARLNSLALLYADRGDYERGLGLLETLTDAHPEFISAKWNLSLLRITVGQVDQGFKEYEIRWQWKEFPSLRRKFDAPRWAGEPLDGKRLLVWREQGIGDEIRFGSLIQELEDSGAEVTIESAPKLVRVFQRGYPWAQVRPEGPRDCRGHEAYQEFDYQIPFGSLTTIYRKSIADFRDCQKPWLPRDFEKEKKLREVMGLSEDAMLVGLCWRSSNRAASRNHLYAEIKDLITLKELKGVTFLNLQYDQCNDELEEMRKMGLPIKNIANINQKDNLVSASVLMGACNIVVTAGTAVLDLACAMGKPTIAFAPKGFSDVNMGEMDYPWTPTCLPLYFGQDQRHLIPHVIMRRWPEILKWAENKAMRYPPIPLEQPSVEHAG